MSNYLNDLGKSLLYRANGCKTIQVREFRYPFDNLKTLTLTEYLTLLTYDRTLADHFLSTL